MPVGQNSELILVGLFFLVISFGLLATILMGWWIQKQKDSLSPYAGTPLRRAETLSFYSKEQVLRFLYDHHSYDNQMFKLKNSSFCRETGRIFPNSITWYDTARVDWDFLTKRYPGNYVSWGSLSKDQKDYYKRVHGSLKGYQTTFSSARPSPRDVEPEFAMEKPGPLYVDINTDVLIGWKQVPGTDLEVLIVQKPLKKILVNVPENQE